MRLNQESLNQEMHGDEGAVHSAIRKTTEDNVAVLGSASLA